MIIPDLLLNVRREDAIESLYLAIRELREAIDRDAPSLEQLYSSDNSRPTVLAGSLLKVIADRNNVASFRDVDRDVLRRYINELHDCEDELNSRLMKIDAARGRMLLNNLRLKYNVSTELPTSDDGVDYLNLELPSLLPQLGRILVSVQNGRISEATEEALFYKLENVGRFGTRVGEVELTIDLQNPRSVIAELRVSIDRNHGFICKDSNSSLFLAVDGVIQKAGQQIRHHNANPKEDRTHRMGPNSAEPAAETTDPLDRPWE